MPGITLILNQAPAYGRRLLTTLIDLTAKTEPSKLFAVVCTRSSTQWNTRDITFQDLSRAISRAAWWFEDKLGGRGVDFPTIAYIGPSDIRYIIFAIAANKAGYKILFPSPGNTSALHAQVLNETGCSILFRDNAVDISKIQDEKKDLKDIEVPSLDWFLSDDNDVAHYPYEEKDSSITEPTVILQSSGSTGAPKLIDWTHENLCKLDAQHLINSRVKDIQTMSSSFGAHNKILNPYPLFHASALIIALGHGCYFNQPNVFPPPGAFDANTVLEAIRYLDLKLLVMRPPILEALAHDTDALDQLRGRSLIYSGAALGDQAGKTLSRYTQVYCMIGSTESGEYPLLTHDAEDWNYFHFPDHLKGLQFREYGENLFELVFVRDEETDCYHSLWITFKDMKEYPTGDLYSRHPHKLGLWRLEGRTIDTLILSTGQTFLPKPFELRLKDAKEIRDALLVGQSRPHTCLLVELSEKYSHLNQGEALQCIIPTIDKINKEMPAFARIGHDQVTFTTIDKPMPRTAKGSAIRNVTLELYRNEIDKLYQARQVQDLARETDQIRL